MENEDSRKRLSLPIAHPDNIYHFGPLIGR